MLFFLYLTMYFILYFPFIFFTGQIFFYYNPFKATGLFPISNKQTHEKNFLFVFLRNAGLTLFLAISKLIVYNFEKHAQRDFGLKVDLALVKDVQIATIINNNVMQLKIQFAMVRTMLHFFLFFLILL